MTEIAYPRPYAQPARPLSMSEWVEKAAETAGLDQAHAWAAMSAALGLLHKHAQPTALQPLYDAVEGAELLARSDEAKPTAGGGLFGGVLKSAGGVSGQAMADAMGAMDRMKKQGVSSDALKRLLPAARQALEAATGRDVLGQAIETVPGLGGLLGARPQA